MLGDVARCPFRIFFVYTGYAGCLYPRDSSSDRQKILCSTIGAILARHMQLNHDKFASFMNDLDSQRVIDAQQEGSTRSRQERERL